MRPVTESEQILSDVYHLKKAHSRMKYEDSIANKTQAYHHTTTMQACKARNTNHIEPYYKQALDYQYRVLTQTLGKFHCSRTPPLRSGKGARDPVYADSRKTNLSQALCLISQSRHDGIISENKKSVDLAPCGCS
jgi:hypothetical protein